MIQNEKELQSIALNPSADIHYQVIYFNILNDIVDEKKTFYKNIFAKG